MCDTHLKLCSMNSDEWWTIKLRANALYLSYFCEFPPRNESLSPRNTFKSISWMTNGSNDGMLTSGMPDDKYKKKKKNSSSFPDDYVFNFNIQSLSFLGGGRERERYKGRKVFF